jgi:hypothetical protein
MKFVAAVLIALWLALVGIHYAAAHSTDHPQHENYTTEEVDWMKRQKSRDGRWCCGPENVTMLESPHLRVRNSMYEVHLLGQWRAIPAASMHNYNPADPSPFGGEVLLFFSTRGDQVTIWCLSNPTGG